MKAIVKVERKQGSIEIKDIDKPKLKRKDVLVNVQAVGVCGSDVHIFNYDETYHHIPVPLVIGHEYSGTVAGVGADVEGFNLGEKVFGEPIASCNNCQYCKTGYWEICSNRRIFGITENGVMSEYVAIPESIIHKMPSGLGFAEATVAQPCGVALHGIERTPFGKGGEFVAVFGPGTIGILTAICLKAFGAETVILFGIDQDEKTRLPIAAELGIEVVNVNKESPQSALQRITTSAEGYDIVFDCCGIQQAIDLGISALRKGGTFMEVGIPAKPISLNMALAVRKQINILTSYSATWIHYEKALNIIKKHQNKISRMIKTYNLQDAVKGIESSARQEVLKSVICF